MKRIKLLTLLFVATLLVQNAAAELLPYSSYYQGRSYFDYIDEGMTGFVDFAVYDTEGMFGDEWTAAGFTAPGQGRYIYAYQIFSDTASPNAIGSFTIMGLNDAHHLSGIYTIDSQNPWENYPTIDEGIEPTGTDVSPGETSACWKFWGSASAILFPGEYSWFLIYSSDMPWVEGKYLMQTESGIPVSGNPEPCTLALLGLGGAILFTKRRSFVRSNGARLKN